ncbi:MAG: hypothetical protein ABSB35_21145, partial [Bryobacteraceae bacterium]
MRLSLEGKRVSIRLAGADPAARLTPGEKLEGVSNYYLGTRAITGNSHYASVRATNVLPGMDIVYYGNGSELEYDFVVHPSADPASVRLRFSGAGKPEIEANGDLVLQAGGQIRLQKLAAWQEVGGQRHIVPCKYRISDDGEVSFMLGPYDRSIELTIDPVISFSTFLSSSGNDTVAGVAVDSSGVYVTGFS